MRQVRIMDLDKFRAQWDDPEFEQSYARLDPEPTSAVIERLKRMDGAARRRRGTRQIIAKALLAGLLGLASVQLFVVEGRELPLQTAAFILELLLFFALQGLDKLREKHAQPKLWLAHMEFLADEQRRMTRNLRFDWWSSALLSAAILCIAMYAAPLIPTGLQIACWAAAAAAVLVLQVFDLRKISALKRSRDELKAQLGSH